MGDGFSVITPLKVSLYRVIILYKNYHKNVIPHLKRQSPLSFMSIENEQVEDVVEVAELTPTLDAEGKDITDWKAIAEARHADAVKNQGIAKRFKTKLDKAKEGPESKLPANPVEKKEPKSDSIDYGELAFLTAKGIEDDEVDFVRQTAKEMGKPLKDVLANKYFQAELKEKREIKKSQEALPTNNKRTSNPARDQVDYWMDKEYSTIPDEMRIKVLNAKIAKEKSGKSNFSPNPIIGA